MLANFISDEKHRWLLGKRIYILMTVASGCFLEVDIVKSANTQALVEGYQSFQTEALALNPDYCPETVNTDGWPHTQAARQTLFPGIQIVLCFLSACRSQHSKVLPTHTHSDAKGNRQALAWRHRSH